MRDPALRRCSLHSQVCRAGLCFVIGVTCTAEQINTAAEADNHKSVRLGFKFDQKAHEAAIAARPKAGTVWSISAEPADPDVVRLPKYVVTDDRILLEEHEVLTPKGKVEIAKKRYLTPMYQKTFGPLTAIASFLNNPLGGWSPNAPEAMAIYEDFENLRRKSRTAELTELADLAEQMKLTRKASPQKSDKPKRR